jgi:hypothetical protein
VHVGLGSISETVASWLFATHTPGPAATAAGPLPTLIRVTLPDRVSTRDRTPADLLVTQTAPSPTGIASAPASTGIGVPAFPVSGSIRTAVRSTEFATHTPPSPNATPVGPFPTAIFSTTCPPFVRGSICQTVPSRLFATQTKPPPTVIATGPFPAPIVCCTVFVSGSIRETESRLGIVTQTEP